MARPDDLVGTGTSLGALGVVTYLAMSSLSKGRLWRSDAQVGRT